MVQPTPFIPKEILSDVLLLNTTYLPPEYEDDGGKLKKVQEDYLYLTVRENKTGRKRVITIANPTIDTFIAKEDVLTTFRTQRKFLYEDQLNRLNVPYNTIVKSIRKEIANSPDKDLNEMLSATPKEAFKWRGAYFSDFNIEDYAVLSYILNHNKYDENENIGKLKVSRSFLDIEADVYGLTSAEMDAGEGPINAISLVIPYDTAANKLEHPNVYTFLLRNHQRYKDQKYFEDHIDDFLDQAHREFDDKYDKPNFIIKVFDEELDLLRAIFFIIHKASPDFVLIWNASYDIPKIIKRLEMLGEDPSQYFSDEEFERKYIHYNEDHVYTNDFKNRNDSFDCTSKTRWMCQMLSYAGLRKAKADYGGNSLDNVSNIELKAEKRRFNSKTVGTLNGALEEYWNFVLYSINDTLLQYGIDKKTGDLDTLFDMALYGGTRITKTMKQSVYLKNVWALEYFKMGIVPGNNMNVDYTKTKNEELAADIELYQQQQEQRELTEDEQMDAYDDLSLPGALVGDPMLIENCGVKLFGEYSNRYFAHVGDFDYSSKFWTYNW